MDVRLKEIPWRFDGRDWVLRCNNNVLAEVQELNGGDLRPILSTKRTMRSVLQLLAAMLNDYADEQRYFGADGQLITYTDKQLGRRLSLGAQNAIAPKVMELVIRAVQSDDAEDKDDAATEKNAETRQEEAAVSTLPGT